MRNHKRAAIEIAFGSVWLAAAFWTSVAAAQLDSGSDRRLQSLTDITCEGETLRELLADLTRRTGTQIAAEGPAANLKAVVYARRRPLDQTLKVLADEFGLAWRRGGDPPAYRYSLNQSSEQSGTERLELLARVVRAQRNLSQDIDFCKSLAALTDDEIHARGLHAGIAAQNEPDPVRRHIANKESLRWAMVAHSRELFGLVAAVLDKWSDDEIRAAFSSFTRRVLRWRAGDKSPTLSEPLARDVMRLVAGNGQRRPRKPAAAPNLPNAANAQNDYNEATIDIRGQPEQTPLLSIGITAGRRDEHGHVSNGTYLRLPIAGDYPPAPTNGPTQAAILSNGLEKALSSPISLTMQPARPPVNGSAAGRARSATYVHAPRRSGRNSSPEFPSGWVQMK